jgi:hypothetical protein
LVARIDIHTTKDNFDALDAIINFLSLDWKTPKKMGAVRSP